VTAIRYGSAPTANGGRYLQQLCKHWSHKFAVEFDTTRGEIQLPTGRVVLTARPDHLEATLTPTGYADLDRLKTVVEDHINRFAFREAPLAFVWTNKDSEA